MFTRGPSISNGQFTCCAANAPCWMKTSRGCTGFGLAALTQAVKRNIERFPKDFAFQLTNQEFHDLKSQIVTSSWGGRRKPPWAFTEHGVAMLSSVLRSPIAARVNIEIMRAFVRLRRLMATPGELAQQPWRSFRDGRTPRPADQGHCRGSEAAHGRTADSQTDGFSHVA